MRGLKAAVRRFRHGSARGRAGEQGQQQHEGHVTLAPSATARLSCSPWPVGWTDGRTSARHGTARRSAVWHGMAWPSAKEYGIYRAENERYIRDPPRPRRRGRRDLFSSCPLRPSVYRRRTTESQRFHCDPPPASTSISFFPSASSPQSIPPFRRTVAEEEEEEEKGRKVFFSRPRKEVRDGETSD